MTTVRAIVDGCIRFPELPPMFQDRLLRKFTFGNPQYYRMLNMGRQMSYTEVPEHIVVARETADGLVLPRGAPNRVKRVIEEKGGHIEWIDRRSSGHAIEIPGGEPIEFRPYQSESIQLIKKSKQGLIVIACGGGKTTVGVGLIEELKISTIVLVHTEDLLDQWVERIEFQTGIRPGIIADGKVRPGPITVGTIQTICARLDDPEVRGVLESAGLLILDEAHHAPANTFRAVVEACPARYRVGLTATPDREDGLTRIMDWSFGDRLIEKTSRELIDAGYLMQPTLEIVETEFEFTSGTEDKFKLAHELNVALEADEARRHLIASVAAAHTKGGQNVLVLANRKEYARQLGRLIWAYGAETLVITGDTTKGARKVVVRKFRSGEVPCLVATSLANEGLDAPNLSRLIFAWPESSKGSTDQKAGRLIRIANKVPILIDIVDSRCGTLLKRYEARARVYRKLGMNPPKKSELTKCQQKL